MSFVSWDYAVLLLLALAAFRLAPAGLRGPVLLAASWVFYAWVHPGHAALLLGVTVLHFVAGQFIHRCTDRWRRKAALAAVVAASLGVLGWFKYADFGLQVVRGALGPLAQGWPAALDILLPAGISFYIFQCIGCTVDIYRGQWEPERRFSDYALFVGFFPQLVAGPIERGRDLLPQLKRLEPQDAAGLEEGFRLLLLGLVKKVAVADRLGPVVLPVLEEPARSSAPGLALASLGLFFMLYFDFSAYTDMARGSARLFGVRLSANFAAPLLAANPADFWRRWHMTLTGWMRDYVFIPLGGMHPRHWLQACLVPLGVMGLLGLWHGASWNFVLWGLFHGAVLLAWYGIHQAFKARLRRLRGPRAWLAAAAGWWATMACHALAMAWFFTPDLAGALAVFARYGQAAAWTAADPLVPALAGVLGVLLACEAGAHYGRLQERVARAPALLRALWCLGLLLAALLLAPERSAPFVYFQF